MTEAPDQKAVEQYFLGLQSRLCDALEQADAGGAFGADHWTRAQGGGGCSRVLEEGLLFEKAGINFSHVRGPALPASASALRPELAGRGFEAMGVSLVLHPRNPFVPSTHMNVRYFSAEKPGAETLWWFGGGFDLTPYYGFEEDARHWHRNARAACAEFGDDLYPELKAACDRYFFLAHRNEARGIGGLFFDDFNRFGFARSCAFMQAVAEHFLPGYLPIVARRREHPWGERERAFQQMRRGRYVEFNLVYDRGTLFGLQSGGRTESILMSLPPSVHWHYNWQAQPGSQEARLTEDFLVPRDWLAGDAI